MRNKPRHLLRRTGITNDLLRHLPWEDGAGRDNRLVAVYSANVQPANVFHDQLWVHRLGKDARRHKRISEILVRDDEHKVVGGEICQLNVKQADLRTKFLQVYGKQTVSLGTHIQRHGWNGQLPSARKLR